RGARPRRDRRRGGARHGAGRAASARAAARRLRAAGRGPPAPSDGAPECPLRRAGRPRARRFGHRDARACAAPRALPAVPLQGRVSSHDEAGGVTRVVLDGGAEVAIPLARERLVGTPVVLAVRAEDVLVTTGAIAGLSARNVLPARVLSLERTGPDVTLRCAT